MIINDAVYGPYEIKDAVLLDLIHSQAMRRLRGVLQHGVTALIGITRPVSRFDHSLGVMILVRELGGDLSEQIAALLHDISHTAFSHVIDYVFGNHDGQSYHDEKMESYLANTDIPGILAHHGHDWRYFIDEKQFPILEQPAPHLCADRLDYFLRDSLDLGLATEPEVAEALAHLVVVKGRIACDDVAAARWMADTYIACDDASWANFREVGLYEVTARAIRRALEIGVLRDVDLWSTDHHAWAMMQAADDAELQRWLRLVSPATRFSWDEEHPTFRISTKLRTIDPDVLVGSRLLPLSKVDHEFQLRRQAYLKRKEGRWPMRIG